MFKQVWIANGKGPILKTALYDTGADVSLIDSAVAQDLDLKWSGSSTTLKSVTGQKFKVFEFAVNIFDPEIGFWKPQKVYVPEENIRMDEKIIIGRDFMQSVGIQLKTNKTHGINPLVLAAVFFAGFFLGGLVFGNK